MSEKDGGPAFPRAGFGFAYQDSGSESEPSQDGMTLRDYFAGQALAGLLSARGIFEGTSAAEGCAIAARWAYQHADALLEERSKS